MLKRQWLTQWTTGKRKIAQSFLTCLLLPKSRKAFTVLKWFKWDSTQQLWSSLNGIEVIQKHSAQQLWSTFNTFNNQTSSTFTFNKCFHAAAVYSNIKHQTALSFKHQTSNIKQWRSQYLLLLVAVINSGSATAPAGDCARLWRTEDDGRCSPLARSRPLGQWTGAVQGPGWNLKP